MEVRWIRRDGELEHHPAQDLKKLLDRTDGFCWVDIALCDDEAAQVLADVFGVHPMAVRDCLEPNPTGAVHAYPNHVLLIMHSPEPGDRGQVRLVELDQLVGLNYLVTVHGPVTRGLGSEALTADTDAVLARIESGRLHPHSPAELSRAIGSSLALRQEQYVKALSRKVSALERWALEGAEGDENAALEDMFRVRHEVLTVAKVASVNSTMYARLGALPRFVPEDLQLTADQLRNQFEILLGMCSAEEKFLQGVLDFCQSRTANKMNEAMERLALITVVMLPVTAVASIYGMNVIVSEETHLTHLFIVLVLMGVISWATLQWARRQGWW